jgi:N-acetylglucosaminyldiphosphoundecaprenol N-acetyl-beta-D-mannosaminyltransferase
VSLLEAEFRDDNEDEGTLPGHGSRGRDVNIEEQKLEQPPIIKKIERSRPKTRSVSGPARTLDADFERYVMLLSGTKMFSATAAPASRAEPRRTPRPTPQPFDQTFDQTADQPLELPTSREALLAQLDRTFSPAGIRQRRLTHLRRSLAWSAANGTAIAARRLADAALAAFLILLLSPLLVILLIAARLTGGRLSRHERLGRWATRFHQYEFRFPATSFLARFSFLHSLPALFNVLKGEMSFIGPRPVSPTEKLDQYNIAWKRYDLRPGLLSLWWIRRRANIAYSSELSLDLEYVETRSFWGDLGIAARAIPAAFLADGVAVAPAEIRVLGIRINNLTMTEASEKIIAMAMGTEPSQVSFLNADCVNIAFNHPAYRTALAGSSLVLADGIGVRLAGTILNQNIRENVNGTDMLPFLCTLIEQANLSVYLMGGKPGVAEGAASWITERYPTLRIAGTHHGYFRPEEEASVIRDIRSSGANILLVSLGTPRQDQWIAQHKHEFGAKVGIGVGGLLDFYSGRIPRAPVWVRELGMEWFYRFLQEPRRMWRRYFVGNSIFLYRVIRERITARTIPGSEETIP